MRQFISTSWLSCPVIVITKLFCSETDIEISFACFCWLSIYGSLVLTSSRMVPVAYLLETLVLLTHWLDSLAPETNSKGWETVEYYFWTGPSKSPYLYCLNLFCLMSIFKILHSYFTLMQIVILYMFFDLKNYMLTEVLHLFGRKISFRGQCLFCRSCLSSKRIIFWL